MIKKLENGSTLIVLGEGTVFTGNVHIDDSNLSSGIYFTNNPEQKGKDDVVIQITNMKAVASYLMGLLRVVETWGENDNVTKVIQDFKKDLEPLLQFDKKGE